MLIVMSNFCAVKNTMSYMHESKIENATTIKQMKILLEDENEGGNLPLKYRMCLYYNASRCYMPGGFMWLTKGS